MVSLKNIVWLRYFLLGRVPSKDSKLFHGSWNRHQDYVSIFWLKKICAIPEYFFTPMQITGLFDKTSVCPHSGSADKFQCSNYIKQSKVCIRVIHIKNLFHLKKIFLSTEFGVLHVSLRKQPKTAKSVNLEKKYNKRCLESLPKQII